MIATVVFAMFLAQVPPAQFVSANGVRLHYLNWGGRNSETILFLTSLGGTADDFHPLAIGLTDRYRVLGLTRRGQGQSEKPAHGAYDNSTLVEDIQAFLDVLNIERVTLVGYSLAGNELTEFAIRYPKRLRKLVYLDAAYDLPRNKELGRKGDIPPWQFDDPVSAELVARSNEYRPDYRQIRAPALGVFVTYDEPPQAPRLDAALQAKLLQWWFDYGRAYRREQIEKFRSEMKRHRVLELHGTTHAGFVFDPKQQRILIAALRRFLG